MIGRVLILLFILSTPLQASDEYGDTCGNAQSISLNETVSGRIDNRLENDIDWLRFTLFEDSKLDFECTSATNFTIQVYSDCYGTAPGGLIHSFSGGCDDHSEPYLYDMDESAFFGDLFFVRISWGAIGALNYDLKVSVVPHVHTLELCQNDPEACGIITETKTEIIMIPIRVP